MVTINDPLGRWEQGPATDLLTIAQIARMLKMEWLRSGFAVAFARHVAHPGVAVMDVGAPD